jgi:hypothetical protein
MTKHKLKSKKNRNYKKYKEEDNQNLIPFIIWSIIIIAIIGFLIKIIFFTCPISCDDGNKCTTNYCSSVTNYKCASRDIVPCLGNKICEEGEYGTSDCPNCDDGNKCTRNYIDYDSLKCITERIVPCCGNGIPELGETCTSCPQDVKCPVGKYCDLGKCVECRMDSDCLKDCNDKTFCSATCNLMNFPDGGDCLTKCSEGICVMCTSNSDCTGWRSFFGSFPKVCKVSPTNPKNNICVDCLSNQDCKSESYPYCDISKNECEECLSNKDCINSPDGPYCITFIGVKMCSEFNW